MPQRGQILVLREVKASNQRFRQKLKLQSLRGDGDAEMLQEYPSTGAGHGIEQLGTTCGFVLRYVLDRAQLLKMQPRRQS